jgi:hypothetical protein
MVPDGAIRELSPGGLCDLYTMTTRVSHPAFVFHACRLLEHHTGDTRQRGRVYRCSGQAHNPGTKRTGEQRVELSSGA